MVGLPRTLADRAGSSARDAVEVADALMYMLTRPRNVTIRDLVILPLTVDV